MGSSYGGNAAGGPPDKVDPHYDILGHLMPGCTLDRDGGFVIQLYGKPMKELEKWFTWERRLLCLIPFASDPEPPTEPPQLWHKED